MSFQALCTAIAKAQRAIQQAEDAVKAGDRAAYGARMVKIAIETRSYGDAITDGQKAVQARLVEVRAQLETQVRADAMTAAVQTAILSIESARAAIPYLVAAAMVDLGGQMGALRQQLADPKEPTP